MNEHRIDVSDISWSSVSDATPLFLAVYEDNPKRRQHWWQVWRKKPYRAWFDLRGQ